MLKFSSIFSVLFIIFLAINANAQGSSFTFQGKLNDNSLPANGTYEMQFRLLDSNSNQVGTTYTATNVSVVNGIFTTRVTFGILAFDGNPRFLEIGVRPAGSTSAFTILAPPQSVLSVPYSLRALNAGTADLATNATNADNSAQLGGIAASQYVLTTDSRLSDARNPLAGSGNYIQNRTSQQSTSNFNISGNGTLGGLLSANTVNSATQFNINNNRVLSVSGTNNIFGGVNSGLNNTGSGNAFFGGQSGQNNTTGINNAFFGFNAGNANNGGGANTFIGVNAGIANVGSSNNTFLGANAGNTNLTGNGNTYLGANSDGGFLITNAVAIGQKAYVGQSDSLVLGSINGVNGATADTNVGIGTSTPSTKLYIRDNQSTSLTIDSSSTQGAGISLDNTRNSGTAVWRIFNDGSALRFYNTTRAPNGEVLSLVTGGGSTGNGSAFVYGDLYTTGLINVDRLGTGGTTSMCWHPSGFISNCSSSLRYKKDLQPFTGGLSLLNQLKPITFRWKVDNKLDLGFGAEDVEKVEPLLVTYNEKGEVEGVKYDRISAVLVNAVNEQQAQIETQQKQIEQQQKLIEAQQKQIEDLKTVVCSMKPDAAICAKPEEK